MTIEETSIDFLKYRTEFSKQDYYEFLRNNGYVKKYNSYLVSFQKLINDGKVHRVGRNRYCAEKKEYRSYSHLYSGEAVKIADCIKSNHPFTDFVIFETVQLNEFINHQIGKNTIFVYVDIDVADFVYETLNMEFQGMVMLSPKSKEFHQYRRENSVVISRLISESPKNTDVPWQISLEKMLVDIIADRLVHETFSESEYSNIFDTAFERYIIDKSKLIRYAGRRNAVSKIRNYIDRPEVTNDK
ncbi:MAG: hypothetical protein PUB89_15795 [Oscillospiraceae bacterium]|nr:hypothetical protein [Oscillospiraceae bacterium]